jgi:hypothetical protein
VIALSTDVQNILLAIREDAEASYWADGWEARQHLPFLADALEDADLPLHAAATRHVLDADRWPKCTKPYGWFIKLVGCSREDWVYRDLSHHVGEMTIVTTPPTQWERDYQSDWPEFRCFLTCDEALAALIEAYAMTGIPSRTYS